MILVDAICRRCGRPIRWACLTAILCKQCREEVEREVIGIGLSADASKRFDQPKRLVPA